MTKLCQIIITFFTIQCFCGTSGSPLFESISIKKAFDISFKPFPFKPIAFIKEKWSPFGKFGVKHAIEKRQTVEEIEEVTPQPPPMLDTPIPEVPLEPTQAAVLKEESKSSAENLEAVSSGIFPVILEPPLSSNFVVIPTTKEEKGPTGLYTDITRALPVNHYFNLIERPAFPVVAPVVENAEPPPPPPPSTTPKPEPAVPDPLENSTIVKGSKFALYFSNMFLQLFSQFMENARITLGQVAPEPPK